jgi:hypothetical protein
LDEIVLPNSNTAQMCAAFVERVRSWGAASNYRVQVYGDAASYARSTAGRSDYQIIKSFFRTEGQFQVSYHNSSANPAVRDRVNAVNSQLCNHDQQRRLIIDPRSKHLIKDLERVSWKADGHDNLLGQVDKSNPQLTRFGCLGLHDRAGVRVPGSRGAEIDVYTLTGNLPQKQNEAPSPFWWGLENHLFK